MHRASELAGVGPAHHTDMDFLERHLNTSKKIQDIQHASQMGVDIAKTFVETERLDDQARALRVALTICHAIMAATRRLCQTV